MYASRTGLYRKDLTSLCPEGPAEPGEWRVEQGEKEGVECKERSWVLLSQLTSVDMG